MHMLRKYEGNPLRFQATIIHLKYEFGKIVPRSNQSRTRLRPQRRARLELGKTTSDWGSKQPKNYTIVKNQITDIMRKVNDQSKST